MKPSTLKKLRALNPNPNPDWRPQKDWDECLTDWYNAYNAGFKRAVLKAKPDFKMP